MNASSFEQILERYHEALGGIINGDPSIYNELFSLEGDVSLANPFAPFGPVSCGRKQVEETVDRAAMNFHGDEVTAFDCEARSLTPRRAAPRGIRSARRHQGL